MKNKLKNNQIQSPKSIIFFTIITSIIVISFSISRYQTTLASQETGRVAKWNIELNTDYNDYILFENNKENEQNFTVKVKSESEVSSKYDLKINGSLPDDIDLNDLMNAFNKFLERQQLQKPLNTKIANKEYSIFERSLEIKKIIKEKKKVSFEELFDIRNKGYIVVTFLSILNLAKTKEVKIEQENNFETIYLCEVK